jgi:hypothetical protein
MQPVRDHSRSAALFSLLFILTGSFFMMNLFVGVVIDNFSRLKVTVEGLGSGLGNFSMAR